MADGEIKTERAYNSKIFGGAGRTRTMQIFTGPVHYNNKFGVGDGVGGFRDIDNSITFSVARNRWEILFNNFQAAMPLTSDGNFIFRDGYQGKDQTIGFQARGTNAVTGALMTDGAISGLSRDYIVYPDAYGLGTDLIVGSRMTSLVKLVRIRAGFYPVADVTFDFAYKFPAGINAYSANSWDKALQGTALITAGVADTTTMGAVSPTQPMYFGNDQADGKNWFTKFQPVSAWDSRPTTYTAPNTATTQKRQFLPWKWIFDSVNNVLVQRKIIPIAFFTGASGDVFTDTVFTPTETQDSFYGTSFLLGPNVGTTTLHCGGFGDTYHSFFQFDLTGTPADVNTLRARLFLYNSPNALSPQPRAARCTSSWTEATLTSTVNPTIDAKVYAFVAAWPNAAQWQIVDLTDMYRGWKTGAFSNFGLRVTPTVNSGSNTDSQINSMENTVFLPYLEITYGFSQGNYNRRNVLKPRMFGPGNAR